MIYLLLLTLLAAIAVLIPQIGQLLWVLPAYLVARSMQIVLRVFGGKNYGRKN